jgi:hypothetical protein
MGLARPPGCEPRTARQPDADFESSLRGWVWGRQLSSRGRGHAVSVRVSSALGLPSEITRDN